MGNKDVTFKIGDRVTWVEKQPPHRFDKQMYGKGPFEVIDVHPFECSCNCGYEDGTRDRDDWHRNDCASLLLSELGHQLVTIATSNGNHTVHSKQLQYS